MNAAKITSTVSSLEQTKVINNIIDDVDDLYKNGMVPPQPISNAKVYADGSTFRFIFTDPENISIPSFNFYEWQKTVIVAKVGAYPTSPDDGIIILTETTKNSYSNTYYTWIPETYDDYYFKAFVYSTKGHYNSDDVNIFTSLAPAAISNPISHKTSTGYELTYSDPVSGELLSWACTYVVRKEGGYPESINDGEIVIKSTVRNQYSSNPYTDIVPDITKNYYYRAFTYSTNNLYNSDDANKFSELTPLAASDCYADKTSNNRMELIWKDPDNYLGCTWQKTVIVRKVGSAPQSVDDGMVIYTETIKNNHQDNTNPYIDTTADLTTDYHYKAFPCSTNGIYNTSSDEFTFKSIYFTQYQYGISTNESNPSNIIRYIGGATTPATINFSTGECDMGSFDDSFIMPTPVMMKDKQVDYELDPNNFTLKKNGGASDVSNSSYGGDCFLQWNQQWKKRYIDESSGEIILQIADGQIDEDYKCITHYNKSGVLVPHIYTQAFEPCLINNKLFSLADQTILVNVSGETMRQYATNKGEGFGFMTFAQIQMYQEAAMLMFKSTNSQATMGAGVVGGTRMTTSGATKDKPMNYATSNSTSSNAAIKVMGMENPWGNHFKWIDGLVIPKLSSSSANRVLKYKMTESTVDGSTVVGYNQTGNGYKTLATFSGDKSGFVNKLKLTEDGLMPDVENLNGSDSTYFADKDWFYGSTSYDYFARFGGDCNLGSSAGLFCWGVHYQLSSSSTYCAASLSYIPL